MHIRDDFFHANALYKLTNVTLSIYLKFLFITPNIRDGVWGVVPVVRDKRVGKTWLQLGWALICPSDVLSFGEINTVIIDEASV